MNVLMDDLRPVKELAIKACRECRFSHGGALFAAASGSLINVYSTYTCELVASLRYVVAMAAVARGRGVAVLPPTRVGSSGGGCYGGHPGRGSREGGLPLWWTAPGQKVFLRKDSAGTFARLHAVKCVKRMGVAYVCVCVLETTGATAGVCRR
jgi:hypothetical protein